MSFAGVLQKLFNILQLLPIGFSSNWLGILHIGESVASKIIEKKVKLEEIQVSFRPLFLFTDRETEDPRGLGICPGSIMRFRAEAEMQWCGGGGWSVWLRSRLAIATRFSSIIFIVMLFLMRCLHWQVKLP